jgi:hypothetical protein
MFEWEVMNGGLHEYFFNNPDPDLLAVVLDGYEVLGLQDQAVAIREVIAPLAEREAAWRESLRDGSIERSWGPTSKRRCRSSMTESSRTTTSG